MSGSLRSGVSTSTVPIFEPFGQAAGSSVPTRSSSSLQASRPAAAAGEMATP